MNLHCNHVNLWQTPTWITNMCMMDADGIHFEFKGKKAVRALKAYLEWAASMLPYRVANTEKETKDNEEFYANLRSHKRDVEAAFTSKDLRVYQL